MFADYFTIKIGEATLKGRRLSLREIKEHHANLVELKFDTDEAVELIRSHVTLPDGSPVDPYELTPGQIRELLGELVLPKEGRSISDFIGLLS